MTYNAASFRKISPDPRAQVWPCTQAAVFSISSLAVNTSRVIEVTETPFVAHHDWLLGAFNVLSFAIQKDSYTGVLRVDIDYGAGVFSQAFVFPLSGENILDTLTGFELGGLAAQFVFVNGSSGVTDATGWIQLRSW